MSLFTIKYLSDATDKQFEDLFHQKRVPPILKEVYLNSLSSKRGLAQRDEIEMKTLAIAFEALAEMLQTIIKDSLETPTEFRGGIVIQYLGSSLKIEECPFCRYKTSISNKYKVWNTSKDSSLIFHKFSLHMLTEHRYLGGVKEYRLEPKLVKEVLF